MTRKGYRKVYLKDKTLKDLWELQKNRGVPKGAGIEYPELSDIIDSLIK